MEVVNCDQASLSFIKEEKILEDHPPDGTHVASSFLEPCVKIKNEPEPEPEFIGPEKIDVEYPCLPSIKDEEYPGDPLSCNEDCGEKSVEEEYGELSAIKKDPQISYVSCGELIDRKQDSAKDENVEEMYSSPGDNLPTSSYGGLGSRIQDPIATGKKTITCSECQQSFTLLSRLKLHMRKHTVKIKNEPEPEPEFIDPKKIDVEYPCLPSIKDEEYPGDPLSCNEDCGEESVEEEYGELSAIKKDPQISYVSCGELIDRKQDSAKDENVEEMYSSPGDNLPTSSYGGLGSRIQDPIATGKKTITCSECQQSFTRLSRLKLHMRKHTGEKPLSCPECRKSFASSNSLKIHIRTHRGEKLFACNECQVHFTTQSSLQRHMKAHSDGDPSVLKPFICSKCESCFSSSDKLKIHSRTHTGEKPFACLQCESAFTTSSHLRHHARTHTGERPFTCSECNSSFAQRCSLKMHIKTHTGEKIFTCSECPSKFYCREHLKIHMRTHTGEKPFSCTICGNKFSQSCNLREHMKTHTGERPYSCPVCQKTYPRSTSLKLHMRTHSGEKPFSCKECARAFSWSSSLLKHKKTHSLQVRGKC